MVGPPPSRSTSGASCPGTNLTVVISGMDHFTFQRSIPDLKLQVCKIGHHHLHSLTLMGSYYLDWNKAHNHIHGA